MMRPSEGGTRGCSLREWPRVPLWFGALLSKMPEPAEGVQGNRERTDGRKRVDSHLRQNLLLAHVLNHLGHGVCHRLVSSVSGVQMVPAIVGREKALRLCGIRRYLGKVNDRVE